MVQRRPGVKECTHVRRKLAEPERLAEDLREVGDAGQLPHAPELGARLLEPGGALLVGIGGSSSMSALIMDQLHQGAPHTQRRGRSSTSAPTRRLRRYRYPMAVSVLVVVQRRHNLAE